MNLNILRMPILQRLCWLPHEHIVLKNSHAWDFHSFVVLKNVCRLYNDVNVPPFDHDHRARIPNDRVYDFTNASSGAIVTPRTFTPSWTITPPGAFTHSLLFCRTSFVLMASWSFFLSIMPRVWFPSFISKWIPFSLCRSVRAFVRRWNKFLQVANLEKFYNVILQCLTLFGRMAKIMVDMLASFGLCNFFNTGIRSTCNASSLNFPWLAFNGE